MPRRQYHRAFIFFLSFFLMLSPNSSYAQGTPQTAEKCELHIWPTAFWHAKNQGLGALFGGLAAIDDASANRDRNSFDKELLKESFLADGGKQQIEILDQFDFEEILTVSELDIVVEEIGNFRGEKRHVFSKYRSTESEATCYFELFVLWGRFVKNPLYPASLELAFDFKYFDQSKKRKIDYYKVVAVPMKKFQIPGQADKSTRQTSISISQSAFKEGVAKFLTKFEKKYRKKFKIPELQK